MKEGARVKKGGNRGERGRGRAREVREGRDRGYGETGEGREGEGRGGSTDFIHRYSYHQR